MRPDTRGDEAEFGDLDALTELTVEATDTRTYMGEVEGSDALVVVTVQGDGFTDVYVCGGDETFVSHSKWFCPEKLKEGGTVNFERDGWTMEATREDPVVFGSLFAPDFENRVVGGGQEFPFMAELASDGLRVGTFQHKEGPGNCSGAIVWQQDDEPVQMIGTYCFDDGVIEQVTPILSNMPTPQSAIVKAHAGTGADPDVVWLLNNEIF